jgi:hypothetical protein
VLYCLVLGSTTRFRIRFRLGLVGLKHDNTARDVHAYYEPGIKNFLDGFGIKHAQ